jgi:hypothetical protein
LDQPRQLCALRATESSSVSAIDGTFHLMQA